jgi:hypothetical protein
MLTMNKTQIADVCEYWTKHKLSQTEMANKKKQVYDKLLKSFGKPNFTKLSNNDVKKSFSIFDKVYFGGKIQRFLNDFKIPLNFKTTQQLTKTAGMCKWRSEQQFYGSVPTNTIFSYEIIISSSIILNIFNKGEKSLNVNGLPCYDRLECYISIFEHELTHLLIMLYCPDLGRHTGGHTETFKSIVRNMYGHTDYKHYMLCGDMETMEKKIKDYKINIKPGDIVETKPIKDVVYKGVVLRINRRTVSMKLIEPDIHKDRIFNVGFNSIEQIKKVKGKKQLVKIEKDKDKIKSNLDVGETYKITIKGSRQNVKILSKGPSRAKVELDNGQVWYIPYSMFEIE